jgi:hypothetical protein
MVSTLSQLPEGDHLVIRLDPKGDSLSNPYTLRFSRLPKPTVTVTRISFQREGDLVRERSNELRTFDLTPAKIAIVDQLIGLHGPSNLVVPPRTPLRLFEAPARMFRIGRSWKEATIAQYRGTMLIASTKRGDWNDVITTMLINQLDSYTLSAENPKQYDLKEREGARQKEIETLRWRIETLRSRISEDFSKDNG